MPGYKAFYKGHEWELYADSSYAAQLEAADFFNARNAYDVVVMLCETDDGEEVIHTAVD